MALVLAAVLLYVAGDFVPCREARTCEPAVNVVGFVGGSMLGVLSFGAFIAADNKRRASKGSGGRGLPRRVIPWITASAWGLGIVHVFGFALHMTRLL